MCAQRRQSKRIGGGRNFTLTGRGTKLTLEGPKPEDRILRPKRTRAGGGVAGRVFKEGVSPYPPARQSGECRKLLHRGSRRSSPGPIKFEIWCNLRPEKSLQKCLMCKSYQTTERLKYEGPKRHSPWYFLFRAISPIVPPPWIDASHATVCARLRLSN